ncbi:hypothetical protein BHOIPH791_08690 [Bartonella henselae]|nr:hypothetical protein BH623125_00480 [Bartonella henselae]GFF04020.1 hypothetical protein BH80429_08410 [Bartonella henselae]
MQYPCSYLAYKSCNNRENNLSVSICLKHVITLGLDVNLQGTAKARALLGKQLYKTTYRPL